MTVRELQDSLQKALAIVEPPVEENRLDMAGLRSSLHEFFESLEERFERSPSAKAKPQWELVMMDSDPASEAAFIAFCVTGDRVDWVAGRGSASEVREFQDEALEGPMERVHPELSKRFTLAFAPVTLPRQTLVAWSGYDPS